MQKDEKLILALLDKGANPTIGYLGQTPLSIAPSFSISQATLEKMQEAAKKFVVKPKEPDDSGDLMKALVSLANGFEMLSKKLGVE